MLALVAFTPAAQANHSWNDYHWATNKDADSDGKPDEFELKLGDNVTDTWDTYLQTASSSAEHDDWSQSSRLDTTIVIGGINPKSCKAKSWMVEVCNAKYGDNGWLGLAQIWLSGKHITQGVTKVNDTYVNRAIYNTPAWNQLVMCQKIGHTFGLDHQDETRTTPNLGTCMDYTNDPDLRMGASSGAIRGAGR